MQSGARFSTEALDLCKHAQTWSSDGLRRSDAGEQGDNGGDHEGDWESLLRLEHKWNPTGPFLLFEALNNDFISIERMILAPELAGYCWHLFSDSQFFDLVISTRLQSDNLGHAQSLGLRPIAWFKFEMATATLYSGYSCTGSDVNLSHAQSLGLRPIAWFKFEMATATLYSGYSCTGSDVNLSHAQSLGLRPIAWFKFEMARATVYSDYSCTSSNVLAFKTSRCLQRHRRSGNVFQTSRPQGLQTWNQQEFNRSFAICV